MHTNEPTSSGARPGLDRRAFLFGVGCLGAAWSAPRALGAPRPRCAADPGRNLVVLQLTGGNDGLATVIPWADDACQRARTTLRYAESECLRLDDYRGLHPSLVGLRERYDRGALAIVEGVGLPQPSRSHFKAMEIWQAADPRGRAAGDGWIGRLCSAAFGTDAHPNRVVHVGASTPYAVLSSVHPAAVLEAPETYRWVREEAELAAVEAEPREAASGSLAFLRERMREARDSSSEIRAAAARYRTPVEYPRGPFGDALRVAAALLEGGLGTRVVSLELGGFDTHNDQRDRHASLLRTLDTGLAAFLADLERSESGRATLVLAFSEFGRRVAENGSRGTDHGCAAPAFLAGACVRGGLFGAHPSLVELDDGDLVHTTDFRAVYASAIAGAFGVDPAQVLGADIAPLDCVAPATLR